MSRNATKRVCCTCLSTDRKLFQLGGIVDGVELLCMLLSHDTKAYKERKNIASQCVCWECSAVIKRIKKFQTQACAAQKKLTIIADSRNVKLQTYSRLSKSHNTRFQYEFQSDDISENISECGTDMEAEYVDNEFDDELLNKPDIKNEPLHIGNDATKIENDSTIIENDSTKIENDATEIESDVTEVGNDAIEIGYDGIEIEVDGIEYENDGIEIGNDATEYENDAIEIENDAVEMENDAVEIENDFNEIGNYLVVKKTSSSITIELETAQNKPKNETKELIKTSESGSETIKKRPRVSTRGSRNKMEPRPRGRPKLADDIQYPCFECDEVFKSGKKRYLHTKIKHSDWFTCATCGKRFPFKGYLERHERLHGGPLPREECATCHKMIRRDLMRAHVVTHRVTEMYTCVPCDKVFKSKLTYTNHLKYSQPHAPEASKHKCPVCPKEYWSRGDLRDHVNYVHKGESDYNCHICGKTLINKKSLKRHIRETHEGCTDRKKICQQCGKTFRSKTTLLEHERTHTGARPLSCAECGKSFRQRAALYNHMRLVHAPREG